MANKAIIHFAPLELYPPIQNLIHELEHSENSKVIILTTSSYNVLLKPYQTENKNIHIQRLAKSGKTMSFITRYWNYFNFYFLCLFHLARWRPDTILYFETLSSLPVYFYQTFLMKSVRIFIHYHEYTSKEEYENGMILSRFFHKLEKKIYPIARWVSHTNSYRMEMFKKDVFPVVVTNPYLLPNYPPRNWSRQAKQKLGIPIQIVYTGALSLQTMYVKEFAEWVLTNNGKVIWDIYTYNYSNEAKDYLMSLNTAWINFRDGIDYPKLPMVLNNYDVGIILYKGHISNYVFNAPNKLFEYLACGLDVWFPNVMKGCQDYVTTNAVPLVKAIDFSLLKEIDINDIVNHNGMQYRNSSFFCEEALLEIKNIYLGKNG
jgi:hypothetical protein